MLMFTLGNPSSTDGVLWGSTAIDLALVSHSVRTRFQESSQGGRIMKRRRKSRKSKENQKRVKSKASIERQLIHVLIRYADADRFFPAKSHVDLPAQFAALIMGRSGCDVIINWGSIHAVLAARA